jgi:hypothetical protein
VVSSPPFLETAGGCKVPRQGWTTAGGMGNPDAASTASFQARSAVEYGTTPGQLGAEPDTFWSASAQIMQELALLLPAGAVCAWVVKAYVKNKAIVPFPQQWLALCEQHGFTLIEEIHASLVEDHGTQEGLFGEAQRVTTEKKSFFRRLAEKKGSPRIDHETVLIMQKAGDVGGVCVVSSPPFGQSEGNKVPHKFRDPEAFAAEMARRTGRSKDAHLRDIERYPRDAYGTTPGNLGNMPAGRI